MAVSQHDELLLAPTHLPKAVSQPVAAPAPSAIAAATSQPEPEQSECDIFSNADLDPASVDTASEVSFNLSLIHI